MNFRYVAIKNLEKCLSNHRNFTKKIHKRNFTDFHKKQTFSHNESRDCRGSNCADSRESFLGSVHLAVPTTPYSSGCKHSTTSAHVTEGTLTAAMSTTSSNTRYTSYGSSSSPRLSASLMTCRNKTLGRENELCRITE